MKTPFRTFATALSFLVISWGLVQVVRAALDPNPSCPGNVCTGTASVGGQDVEYGYSLNQNDAASSLKVRFTAPAVLSGASPARYQVTVSKSFSTHSVLKNPAAGTVLPGEESVNLAETQIERFETTPSTEDAHDFTFNLGFNAPDPGTITLDILVARNGSSTNVGPFTIQLDASAPTNRNEGESLTPIYGAPADQCYDGVDNDLDYLYDCRDANCVGVSIGGGSFCEATESTCNDGKDNDGDGLIDCADPHCNGLPGDGSGNLCGSENGGTNHANCADGFDNDGNGKTDCHDDTPGTGCWKTGFQDCAAAENTPALCSDNIDNDRDANYSEDIDALAGTGIDCRDYDCAGIGPTCPSNERLKWDEGSGTFIDDPSQCFNGLDDDLDGDFDCADIDCLAAFSGSQACAGYEAWLPPSPLGTGAATSTPAFYFNLCDDGLDNDGDVLLPGGGLDETDPDCQDGSGLGRFGFCGPVPSTEDYTFLSCTNALDDDLDGDIDCGDSQCRDGVKLGRRGCVNGTCSGAGTDTHDTDAALCRAAEGDALSCGDGFDNDANGVADCEDPSCSGINHGYATFGGYVCSLTESGAACGDGVDNDNDGDTDCMDSACQDGIQCAERPPAGWTLAPVCVTVPHTTDPAPIIAGGNVEIEYTDRVHVGDAFTMRFMSTGTVTSFTATIGDDDDPAKAFPFDATLCSISGPSSGQMTYSGESVDLGVLTQNAGESLSPLDVTVTCTADSILGPPAETFEVAVVANRNSVVEFGTNSLSVQVYESTAPTVGAVEIEGEVGGVVNVPVGGSVRMQVIPSDDASGICSCDYDLDGGNADTTADGNCFFDSADVGLTFANDFPNLSIDVESTDGADNTSTTFSRTVDINILPSIQESLTLGGPLVHSYRGGDLINLSTKFVTDTANDFDSASCAVYLYNESTAPSLQVSPNVIATPFGDTLTCQGTFAVPAGLAPGRWHIAIQAFDSSGDPVRSNEQAFLKCDFADVGTGACADADFDFDGVPEGRYTPGGFPDDPAATSNHQTPTYPGASPHACDNCINFYNPSQIDRDANGIGDSCETGVVGRCKYLQCAGGDDAGEACVSDDDCTSGECKDVSQAMCTINCSADADCQSPNTEVDGVCSVDWGVCGDNEPPAGAAPDAGNCCFADRECSSGSCDALVDPFIETMFGQIYSGGSIRAGEESPIANATYCIQANGDITNFTSASGCKLPTQPGYEIPKAARNYVGSFGVLDVNGILGGKYGQLQSVVNVPTLLDGKIYHFASDKTVSTPTVFVNGSGASRGNGLVVVVGDLTIGADLGYENQTAADLSELASVGWIVLDDGSGTKGNVFIDPSVEGIVGAIFAEGIISTGSGEKPLDITGMLVAKGFAFEREFASRTQGSERVDFDARVILNPPPGMTDVTRSLPGFQTVSGQ